MVQLGRDARLAEKARDELLVLGEALGQHLERDGPVHGRLPGLVDDAHAALAELLDEFEAGYRLLAGRLDGAADLLGLHGRDVALLHHDVGKRLFEAGLRDEFRRAQALLELPLGEKPALNGRLAERHVDVACFRHGNPPTAMIRAPPRRSRV